MSNRPSRRHSRRGQRADPGLAQESLDEETEADDIADQDTSTSVTDLTATADPNAFGETFTDDDASLNIAGSFDPTAGTKQVLPRVAYTINYNLVYNPDRDRWEPDEGNETGDTVLQAQDAAQPTVAVETDRVSPNTGQQPTINVTVS